MSKFFTTLTFTFFLLFQTTALAEEGRDTRTNYARRCT